MSVAEPILCCAPLSASSLSDDEALATAELFKALGDPTRVRIVNLIARSGGEMCACDLVEPVGLAQPTVSHHLKKLLDAGLLQREQRGKWAFFSLKRDAIETLAAVQKGQYRPLARPLFIYATRDSFRRPVVAGYLGYIFNNEKAIAKRSGYIALTDRQLKKARYQYRQALKANNL